MDEIALTGFTEEQEESLREAVRKLAERTTLSMEEAAERLLDAARYVLNIFRSEFNKFSAAFRELAEELKSLNIEPRARRRKRMRARANEIERRYREEIRQAENTRIYRRIYKPP